MAAEEADEAEDDDDGEGGGQKEEQRIMLWELAALTVSQQWNGIEEK